MVTVVRWQSLEEQNIHLIVLCFKYWFICYRFQEKREVGQAEAIGVVAHIKHNSHASSAVLCEIQTLRITYFKHLIFK